MMHEPVNACFKENVPLLRFNTWRLNTIAKRMFTPTDFMVLQEFLKTHPQEKIHLLGLGSNILLPDEPIDGTVILLHKGLSRLKENQDTVQIYAQGGVPCAKVARLAAKLGWAEGEFFAGIPGTVGGALAMNAGAFGGTTWDHVVSVDVITRRGELKTQPRDSFETGYRTVKREQDLIFVGGLFQLSIAKQKDEPQKRITQLLQERAEKQPIGAWTCGSVFKNPPHDHAGRLIEAAGLKGYCIGGAEFSKKHANFIENKGDATSQNIRDLISLAQRTVKDCFQLSLVPEVQLFGNHTPWSPLK